MKDVPPFVYKLTLGLLTFGVLVTLAGTMQVGTTVWAILTWDSAPCEITAIEVQPPSGQRRTYQVAVRYVFEDDGIEFTGSSQSFGIRGYEDGHDADAIAARYPVGTRTTCYFDPADPDGAVLSRQAPTDAWLFMGMGLVVFGIGAYMFKETPLGRDAIAWVRA